MDSNKDEAARAIEIAIAAINDNNLHRAEKFLKKAEKLYPTAQAKSLLEDIQNSGTENMKRAPSNENLFRKRETAATSSTQPETSQEIEYSTDQVELVKKIKKCKDYYEALGVSKDAPDLEIRKAYKKLALQLHPDKNKAPGAVEAFKAIGNAVAILTDAEKRKQYDLYGNEEATTRRTPQYSAYGFSRGFEADGTTEEIFNMFFGGGFPQTNNIYMRQRRFHRTEQREHQHQQQQSGYAAFINLLPIILLIGLSMVSSFFISDPIYSLTPSQKYTIARKTNALKIPYYVKDNFHTEYQGSVGRLDTSVEEEYLNNLKHACYRERNYKDSMLMKARNFGDRDLYQKAQNIATPSCEKLHTLQNT